MWFKVDDGFAAHRKVEQLQGMPVATYTAAITIWTLMGSDCGCHLTDGKFTRLRVRKVTGLPDKVLDAGLAALVKVGLFDMVDGECAFHDWASMQPTKAEVDARRAAKAAAGKLGGQASGEVRSKQVLAKNEAGASPDTKQPASTTPPVGEPSRAVPPSRPVPSGPDPKIPPPTPSGRETGTPPEEAPSSDPDEAPPDPRMDEDDAGRPIDPETTADEAPEPRPQRPYVMPPLAGPAGIELLGAIADASGGVFVRDRGSELKRRAMVSRLRSLNVTLEIAAEMGALLRDPKRAFPKAKGLGDGSDVSVSWLLGKADEDGTYPAEWLCNLVASARSSIARRAQESAVAESRRQAALAAQATPARPAATAADAAASRPAFMRAVTPAALPNAEAVTHG